MLGQTPGLAMSRIGQPIEARRARRGLEETVFDQIVEECVAGRCDPEQTRVEATAFTASSPVSVPAASISLRMSSAHTSALAAKVLGRPAIGAGRSTVFNVIVDPFCDFRDADWAANLKGGPVPLSAAGKTPGGSRAHAADRSARRCPRR